MLCGGSGPPMARGSLRPLGDREPRRPLRNTRSHMEGRSSIAAAAAGLNTMDLSCTATAPAPGAPGPGPPLGPASIAKGSFWSILKYCTFVPGCVICRRSLLTSARCAVPAWAERSAAVSSAGAVRGTGALSMPLCASARSRSRAFEPLFLCIMAPRPSLPSEEGCLPFLSFQNAGKLSFGG